VHHSNRCSCLQLIVFYTLVLVFGTYSSRKRVLSFFSPPLFFALQLII
jgi:hypothetical protein